MGEKDKTLVAKLASRTVVCAFFCWKRVESASSKKEAKKFKQGGLPTRQKIPPRIMNFVIRLKQVERYN